MADAPLRATAPVSRATVAPRTRATAAGATTPTTKPIAAPAQPAAGLLSAARLACRRLVLRRALAGRMRCARALALLPALGGAA